MHGDTAAHSRFDRVIIATLVLAITVFAVHTFVLDPQRDAAERDAARQEGRTDALIESFGDKSIAVLAFENMSSDPEQAYFADGISEELLNLLARVEGLRVTSRTSAGIRRIKGLFHHTHRVQHGTCCSVERGGVPSD